MNNFKKTLLATAVLGISGTASAGLSHAPTATKLTPSIEAIETAAVVSSGTTKFETAANYGVGDTISLVSNIAVDATQVFATAGIVAANCDIVSSIAGSMTASFAGYDASTKTATYTVGAAGATTIGCELTFPGIKYDGAVLAAADKATLALSTSRGFGTLESVAAVETINVAPSQFAVVVTNAADETIDVNNSRNSFVGYIAGNADTTDIIKLTTTTVGGASTAGAGAVYDAGTLKTSTVITGDFAWAKVVNANTAAVTYPAIAVGGTGTVAAGGITDTTITFAHTIGAATVTFTPDMALTTLATLPATTDTAVTTLQYEDADAVEKSKVINSAAGNWKLNGASITAHGVSNSPSVTPMIWIQNSGTSNGAISGSVNCNGTTITIPDLGSAAPLANTKVGEAIQTAIDANGTCSTVNTRYDATVTVNGPAADITMNASYKVTAADGATDRVMLETSDSLPSSSN